MLVLLEVLEDRVELLEERTELGEQGPRPAQRPRERGEPALGDRDEQIEVDEDALQVPRRSGA